MAAIPVHCSHCGAIFASRAFAFAGNIKGMTLRGNQETCTVCGKMADIIDGTFDVANDALSMISGPKSSKVLLESLSRLIERAQRKEIDSEELEKQVGELDPELGKVIAKVKGTPAMVVLLVILLYFI